MDSTGTYGDALRYKFRQSVFAIYQMNAKRVADAQEVYDGAHVSEILTQGNSSGHPFLNLEAEANSYIRCKFHGLPYIWFALYYGTKEPTPYCSHYVVC
jgi:hypothetical protein